MIAMVLVAAAAAAFAHVFRETGLRAVELLTGTHDPTEAARDLPMAVVASLIATTAAVAAGIGHRIAARRRKDVGITAIAAWAREQGPAPSMPATLVRSSGTWLASAGLVSVGRESAILETSGAFGSWVARRVGHRRALAAGGIAAAFAAAYHAPFAGVLYVEEHLRIRRDGRAVAYSVIAVALSHVIMRSVFGGHAIFPQHRGDYGGMALLGAIAVVPAVVGARLFLELRHRATPAARDPRGFRRRRALVGVAVAAAVVALVPLTAGNGMEALRSASTDTTIGVALALGLAKLAATTATLGTGTPGGAFSPTLAVSSGWALMGFLALDTLGVPLPGSLWDGMLVAMAVGVAVGLQAPLTAVFVVPEMAGDLALLPVCAAAVLVAWTLDRQVTAAIDRRRRSGELRDDDA